jgi:hypothetical protein
MIQYLKIDGRAGIVLPDGSFKISIPPTLLFSVVAKIPNVALAQTMDVKNPGDYEVDYTKRKFVKVQEGSNVFYNKYNFNSSE